MPEYKLTYFNGRARGELIRLIFHASGIKFEDKRIEFKDWPALKPTTPQGGLPVLEFDGEMYSQSSAIARYVAKQGGLMGKNAKEELKVDGIVDMTRDYLESTFKPMFEKDETKKAELMKEMTEKTTPNILQLIKNQIAENGGNFLVGKSLTVADLAVFNILDTAIGKQPTILDESPELKAFQKRIGEIPKVNAYLKARSAERK